MLLLVLCLVFHVRIIQQITRPNNITGMFHNFFLNNRKYKFGYYYFSNYLLLFTIDNEILIMTRGWKKRMIHLMI